MTETDANTASPAAPALDLRPAEQALFQVEGRRSPLTVLPDAAFENLVVVSTRESPGRIEADVRSRDADLSSVGVVPITATALSYEGPLWTTERVPPTDLTGISIRVSQAFSNLSPGQGWLIFDTVSTLLMYAAEDRVYRLFDWLVRNTREASVRGVYTVQPAVVADSTLAQFRGLCDDVIQG